MGDSPRISRLVLLHAEVGRGHPFYLDWLGHELGSVLPDGVRLEVRGASDVSRPLGRWAWAAIRQLYRRGSSPGIWSGLYTRLRRHNDYNRDQLALKLLRASLRDAVGQTGAGPILVSHPLLVAALRPHPRILYQHGELVTPPEAVVMGAQRVFVPTSDAAAPFLSAGYDPASVCVTGLCIEPALAARADEYFRARVERLTGKGPLTGAYFSSGAEPSVHVRALAKALASAIRSGGTSHVFAARSGRLAAAVERAKWGLTVHECARLHAHVFASRAELDRLTVEHFHAFDFFVAPPHERSNWALGLGLPQFVVDPPIGPFAPLNRRLLLAEHVAQVLDDADLGARLEEPQMREELAYMARWGLDRHSILGFSQAARYVVESLNA